MVVMGSSRPMEALCRKLFGWAVHARDCLSSEMPKRLGPGLDVQWAGECVGYEPLGDRDAWRARRVRALEAVRERKQLVAVGADLGAADDHGGGSRGRTRSASLGDDGPNRPSECSTVPAAFQLLSPERKLRSLAAPGAVCQRGVECIPVDCDA
jgi:hypothetical protein